VPKDNRKIVRRVGFLDHESADDSNIFDDLMP